VNGPSHLALETDPTMFLISLPLTSTLLALAGIVSALGTSCTAPLGAGTSGPNAPFWMQSIKHQGTAPFNPNPSSYTVFRNVKVSTSLAIDPCLIKFQISSQDFGAVGDGVHDDTSAIK